MKHLCLLLFIVWTVSGQDNRPLAKPDIEEEQASFLLELEVMGEYLRPADANRPVYTFLPPPDSRQTYGLTPTELLTIRDTLRAGNVEIREVSKDIFREAPNTARADSAKIRRKQKIKDVVKSMEDKLPAAKVQVLRLLVENRSKRAITVAPGQEVK
jgi:hypothetical protein